MAIQGQGHDLSSEVPAQYVVSSFVTVWCGLKTQSPKAPIQTFTNNKTTDMQTEVTFTTWINKNRQGLTEQRETKYRYK